MKTDQEWKAWLRDDSAERIALYNITVDVDGVANTLKLSRHQYRHAPYKTVIERGLVTSQKISPDGAARLSAGDVRLNNLDGNLDAWLNYVWANGAVEVLLGDERWPLADFRVHYRGVVEGCVTAGDNDEWIDVTILDRMKQLDAPLSEATLADGTLIPVALGECPNVTPKWDQPSQSWVYHARAAVGLVAGEARVEGRPRWESEGLVAQNAAAGRFQFETDVKGAVTCSVWGDATGGVYRNTIAQLVRLIVTAYGKTAGRFTDADIDLANFDAFDQAHQQSVHLYAAERMNCGPAIAYLASSVQAQLLPSPLGPLRLVQWGIPAVSTADIRPSDYVTIRRGTPLPVTAAVKIAYCKNNTPQQPQASIPDEHRALFVAPWRTKRAVRQLVADRYRLPTDVAQIDTALNNPADAQAEAERRADQVSVQRVPYAVDAFAVGFEWTIGQGVTLYGDRFDLGAGKRGQITMLETDYDIFHVTTEVTV